MYILKSYGNFNTFRNRIELLHVSISVESDLIKAEGQLSKPNCQSSENLKQIYRTLLIWRDQFACCSVSCCNAEHDRPEGESFISRKFATNMAKIANLQEDSRRGEIF